MTNSSGFSSVSGLTSLNLFLLGLSRYSWSSIDLITIFKVIQFYIRYVHAQVLHSTYCNFVAQMLLDYLFQEKRDSFNFILIGLTYVFICQSLFKQKPWMIKQSLSLVQSWRCHQSPCCHPTNQKFMASFDTRGAFEWFFSLFIG